MKVLRLPELQAKIGLRHTKIYQLIAEGKFPAPLELGPRARGWLEAEVDEWLKAKASQRRPAKAA